MEETLRKHIVFHGWVQGVGFRYRAYHAAQQLGLAGWVRNLSDGTVEMEVQGKEKEIDAMIAMIERSRYIRILKMDVKKLPPEEHGRGFRIR